MNESKFRNDCSKLIETLDKNIDELSNLLSEIENQDRIEKLKTKISGLVKLKTSLEKTISV